MVPRRKHFHIIASDETEVVRVHCASPASNPTQAIFTAYLIAAAPELLTAATKMLAFYNDLAKSNPGFMGKLTLQDYAQWNEALIELPRAIAKALGN